MKIHRLFMTAAAALLSSAVLTACVRDTTATVLYDNEYLPLTKMTYSTELPPETYSEYMATYTPPSETDTNDYYYSVFRNDGVIADTRVTAPPEDTDRMLPLRDTAVPPADTAGTRETAAETSVPESFFSEETETCVTSVTERTGEPAVSLERPHADTGMSGKVSADTMVKPTAPPTEETTSESSLSE